MFVDHAAIPALKHSSLRASLIMLIYISNTCTLKIIYLLYNITDTTPVPIVHYFCALFDDLLLSSNCILVLESNKNMAGNNPLCGFSSSKAFEK